MNARFSWASLFVLILAFSTTHELAASELIKTIRNGPELQKSIEAIVDNKLVYLDVSFDLSAVTNNTQCGQGWFGPLVHSNEQEFRVKPGANDNHLLMEIYPGAKTQFPYNAVSCPYDASNPSDPLIRFRGFYIALRHSIPTANLIELRPMNIPYDLAASVLLKSKN